MCDFSNLFGGGGSRNNNQPAAAAPSAAPSAAAPPPPPPQYAAQQAPDYAAVQSAGRRATERTRGASPTILTGSNFLSTMGQTERKTLLGA